MGPLKPSVSIKSTLRKTRVGLEASWWFTALGQNLDLGLRETPI